MIDSIPNGQILKTPESFFLFGTEDGRGLNKKIYCISNVKLLLPDSPSFEHCKVELRLFSSVLKNRRAEDVFYGWDKIYCFPKIKEIDFDILWYNLVYFQKRKNAFKSIFHQKIFNELKLEEKNIYVEHSIN